MKGLVRGICAAVVCGAVVVREVSPCVSACIGLKQACISGSLIICRFWSVFLCLNQLIIRRPFCCVVRGSTGLIGVRSALNDLRGTVC